MEIMDGRNLYYTFIAGAKKVIENQIELNRINVFPVNDGDTGTNLASTIRSVIESIHPHRSYKITADRIAEATLLGARGNSGIIFAQFFYGLSVETGDHKSITLKQFAESIQRSVKYVYEAVANPVEGTMLTVIKEWAEYIYQTWHKFSDFNHLMVSSYEILRKSLIETKSKLKILAKNNVVDAGAKGFVLFVEGIIEFIQSRNIKELILSKSETSSFARIEEVIAENVDFRYCTEAVIKNSSLDSTALKSTLAKYGDSVVVAGSEKIKRLHVHTNTPAELFDELRYAGTLSFQKADDMIRQSQAVYDRKWNIALVTDSTCDLSQELIDHYQINMLPININFGENHYLDKVTIKPEQFYKLLDETSDFPKSSQVNEAAFVNLYSHLASNYDSIIAIHLSDKLSGTYNSSLKAARSVSSEFNKPVSVLNSRNLSGALGLIILRAAQAIEAGLPHDQIVVMTEKWISKAKIFVSVRTLKYMVRGGRVSAVKGLLARLLNINPIVSLDETGKAIVFDKAFNQKSNMEKVMNHIRTESPAKIIWNYIVLHANNKDAAEWYSEKMETFTGKKPVSVVNISPVIGANSGVGAASVALLYE
ncbi:MAG: fatty acid-binding protein DegV [Bacteroidetes bacterium RBG_13_43_22]|nr:MAG: fatty acid-binding protein DegV [Bacteroidetes bacterium RBG_13_43_22]